LDLSIEASAKLEALRGLPRGEALRGFRLGQIVQDSQKQ
jgi:hypothetical protein